MTTTIQRVRKSAWERKLYQMFGFSSEMRDGDAITGAPAVPTSDPSGLVFEETVIDEHVDDGYYVQTVVSGGVAGTVYKISSRVTTDAGDMIERFGEMEVIEE